VPRVLNQETENKRITYMGLKPKGRTNAKQVGSVFDEAPTT